MPQRTTWLKNRKFLLAAGAGSVIVWFVPGLGCAAAARQRQGPEAPSLAFDVVSIKPIEMPPPGPGMPGFGPRVARLVPAPPVQFFPGRVTGRNVTARAIILGAFQLPVLQLSGGPDWLDWDRFDLEAKASAPASGADLRAMLQTMLADRFHMQVHRERQQMRVFALVVARNGPKLPEWKEGQPMPTRSPNKKVVGAYLGHGTMQHLAEVLSQDPGAFLPVVDRTGLTGVYALRLEWQEKGTMLDGLTDLGLKLRTQKDFVEMLVVDRLDRPTAN